MTHDSGHRRAQRSPQTRTRWCVAAPLLLAASALLPQHAHAQTVVLRESIGPDATWTNGRRVIANTAGASTYSFLGIAITPAQTITLREVSMVIASWSDEDPPLDFSHYDYDVRVWSSPSGMIQSPFHPDVLHCRFTHPSNASSNDAAPPLFATAVSAFDVETPSFVITFDLASGSGTKVPGGGDCPPTVLEAGHAYGLAIQPLRGETLNSAMGQVDSLEAGPGEFRYSGAFPLGKPLTDFSTPELSVNGRASYRVIGIAQNSCPADFNTDGFLDFTDFDAFVSAFEGGSAGGDFNGDGFLDFTDFDAFVTAFEAGC